MGDEEPIGDFVAAVQAEDPEVAALVDSPERQLAFRTFAYIRVGLLLGQMLADEDVKPEASRTWVDDFLATEKHRDALTEEVRAVARQVAADPKAAQDQLGPDPETRERFRQFARRSLGD